MKPNNRTERHEEQDRLQALARYHVLDTPPETQFDEIAELAASICSTPMAVVTLMDENRQWFKSRVGIDVPETPRESAFCDLVVRNKEIVIIPDTLRDVRFADNPLVVGEPFVRFYAGAPLFTRDGYVIGSLGVLDRVPRMLTGQQHRALDILSHEVVAQLELRRSMDALQQTLMERDKSQEQLRLSYRNLERQVAEQTADLNSANVSLRAAINRVSKEAEVSQTLIDSLPGIFYVFDAGGRYLRWNRNLERLTGLTHDEIAASGPLDFLGNEDEKSQVDRAIHKVLEGENVSIEAHLQVKGGKRIPYYFSGVRIELDGRPCVSGMGFDITQRRMAEESLRLRNRAIQASVNAIIITDLEGKIEYTNPAFERITGYSVGESVGKNCRFLQGTDREQPGVEEIREAIRQRTESSVLLRNYRKNGELFWNEVHVAPVRGPDDEVTHFVGVLNDITELKHYEQELERQANIDPLTLLPNRNVLKDRIGRAIATAKRLGTLIVVGFMDLDNFKFINDSLGHNIGDELLKQVAERLLACLRGEDTVARYGGDEFAFVLRGQKDEQGVATLMKRVMTAIERPFSIDSGKFFVSCSIGLSFYPRDGEDVDTLLRNADAAMYRAKESGRNNFQFYTPAMNARATERLSLESRMRQALNNGEFALHYQPKVDLFTGEVVGVEALLRWFSDAGAMSPSEFIPLAEETGLIVPMGAWALYTACSQIKSLQDEGLHDLRVAVNISARQMVPGSIIDTVRSTIATTGLDARFLELELTESAVMLNPEDAIKLLQNFQKMGVHLSIDDFGTGYSSLSYLQRFPVDRLKIDQSFVQDIGKDPNDAIIARAVISLGHSLGLRVIAEGVSTREQLNFLRGNGCDEMQGYLFSGPVPLSELKQLLKDGRPMRLC